MIVTMQSTRALVKYHGVMCRLWFGSTIEGNKVEVYVPIMATDHKCACQLMRQQLLREHPEREERPWYHEDHLLVQ